MSINVESDSEVAGVPNRRASEAVRLPASVGSCANWDHFKTLLAVARTGTLSGAALQLGVKHSTVGRHLTALENIAGSRMIDRGPAGITLTAAGERFVAAVETVEDQIMLAQEEIWGRDGAISGVVRIGAPESIGSYFLASNLSSLLQRYPGLTIQLVTRPGNFNLTRREVDIAIVDSLPDHGRLQTRKLVDYDIGIYGGVDYLKSMPPVRHRRDLAGLRFVGGALDATIGAKLFDLNDEMALGTGASFQVSSPIAQMNAAIAGAGLVVLPHFMAAHATKLAPVLPDEIRFQKSFWVLVHETQRNLKRISVVTDYLANTCKMKSEQFISNGTK